MTKIFTKTTALNDYYRTHKVNQAERCICVKDVTLILEIKKVENAFFCKIKCPINPLPVVGWFEVPSISVIEIFLKSNGWHFDFVKTQFAHEILF